MLTRHNFYLLLCILFIAGVVVAEPPYSTDLYESMVRAQSQSNDEVVRTASAPQSKGRPVAVQTADAATAPAPITSTTAEPIQSHKPAPLATTAPGNRTPAAWVSPTSPCQNCSPPQQWGRARCVWHHYIYSCEP